MRQPRSCMAIAAVSSHMAVAQRAKSRIKVNSFTKECGFDKIGLKARFLTGLSGIASCVLVAATAMLAVVST